MEYESKIPVFGYWHHLTSIHVKLIDFKIGCHDQAEKEVPQFVAMVATFAAFVALYKKL